MSSIIDIQFKKTSQIQEFDKFFAAISNANGFKRAYQGVSSEDDSLAICITVWDSAKQRAEAFKNVPTGLVSDGEHVFSASTWIKPLSAPVTEVVFITLSDPASRESLAKLHKQLVSGLNITPGAHPPCASEPSDTKPDTIIGLIGWDSVQAHVDGVSEGTKLREVIDDIKQLANIELKHWELKPMA